AVGIRSLSDRAPPALPVGKAPGRDNPSRAALTSRAGPRVGSRLEVVEDPLLPDVRRVAANEPFRAERLAEGVERHGQEERVGGDLTGMSRHRVAFAIDEVA